VISFLRGKLQGIVAFSFLIIVALTFAFLGLPTFTQTFSENNYAKLGNYEISQSEYFRAKGQVEQNLRDQFGQDLDLSDPSLIDAVQNLTNNSLIEKYTIINFLDEFGINVPDTYVETELSKSETFRADGEFSQELFKNYLVNFNLSKEDLVNDFKSDLKVNLAVSFLSATANSFDKSVEQYLDLLTERRTVKFAEITTENVITDFVPTDEEIESFYSSNLNNYTIPEKRSFFIAKGNLMDMDLEVSDEELSSAYNLYLENLPEPEKRISHIMLIGENYESKEAFSSRKAEVEDVLTNTNFEQLVLSYSDDLGTKDLNGDLGFTNGDIFPTEFERVIADLDVGDVSEAIPFEGNVHFLKVTELDGADIESFEEKRSELEGELKQIAFEAKILEISNAIGGQAYNLEEVADFAKSFSLSLENFENQNISQTNFNFADPAAVFNSQIGSWSQAVELSNDEYAFVYVYDVIAQSTEELASVESSIVDSLIDINKGSYLDNLFASEEEFVLEADALEEVFSLNNVTVDELKNINRSTSLLKSDLINILFNEYETGVTLKALTNDGLLLYTVVNRTKGDISQVSDEDKVFINEETQRNLLQTAFNKLRLEYDLDNKLNLNNQFTALNS
jgi:peptidyl-prolyl cis-trans isomerase D